MKNAQIERAIKHGTALEVRGIFDNALLAKTASTKKSIYACQDSNHSGWIFQMGQFLLDAVNSGNICKIVSVYRFLERVDPKAMGEQFSAVLKLETTGNVKATLELLRDHPEKLGELSKKLDLLLSLNNKLSFPEAKSAYELLEALRGQSIIDYTINDKDVASLLETLLQPKPPVQQPKIEAVNIILRQK